MTEHKDSNHLPATKPFGRTAFDALVMLPSWLFVVVTLILVVAFVWSAISGEPVKVMGQDWGFKRDSVKAAGSEIAAWAMIAGESTYAGDNIRSVTYVGNGKYAIAFEKEIAYPYCAIATGRFYSVRVESQDKTSILISTWTHTEKNEDGTIAPPEPTESGRINLVVIQGPEQQVGEWD